MGRRAENFLWSKAAVQGKVHVNGIKFHLNFCQQVPFIDAYSSTLQQIYRLKM